MSDENWTGSIGTDAHLRLGSGSNQIILEPFASQLAIRLPGSTTRTLVGSSASPSAFNVKSGYGAKGDGTTDDTAAITAATVAAAVSGGQVSYPPGTYMVTGDIPISTNVEHVGSGYGEVIIKLIAGSTKNVFTGDNFATLTGGTSTAGVFHFGLRNLLIDGNKSNCPSGLRGVAFYGFEYVIEDVLIHNCQTDGFYTEWNGSGNPVGTNDLFEEAYVTNLKTFDNNGNGTWGNGPHDSYFYGCISARNGANFANFRLEGKSCNWVFCHGWSQAKYAWYTRGQENLLFCQGEACTTAQLFVEFNDLHAIGFRAFNPSGSAPVAAGIVIGDSTHTPTKVLLDGFRVYKGLAATGDMNPSLDVTHAGVGCVLSGSIDQAAGTPILGTFPADADVEVSVNGGATSQPTVIQHTGQSALTLVPAIIDTFAGADASVLAAKNWTASNGGASGATVTIAGQRAQFVTGATGSFSANDNVYAVANLPTFADGEVVLKVEIGTNTTERYLFVGQRCSATNFRTGSTNAYWFQYQNNTSGVAQTQLNKRVAGTSTLLQQSSNFSPATGSTWFVKFRVQGSFTAYKWWQAGLPEPYAWTFSVTDTAVTAANPVVIFVGSGSAATAVTTLLHSATVQAL